MAGGGGEKPGAVKSDINITPLVDVVLVLLIIFMVVTPELQRGKEVQLPAATTAKQRENGGDPIIVSAKADKTFYIEQDQTALDQIGINIKTTLENTPGRNVVIKGDKALLYGDVKALIAEIRKSGAPGVSLAASVPEGK